MLNKLVEAKMVTKIRLTVTANVKSYLNRPDTASVDRHADRYQVRIGALALRETFESVLCDLAEYVVSAGTQRTAYSKLHRAAVRKSKGNQAECMARLGWPLIVDEDDRS